MVFPVLVKFDYRCVPAVFDCVSDLSGVFKVLSVQFALVWSTGYCWCSCVSALFVLKTVILSYILVSVFLTIVSTVTEDQTYTVSGAHSPRFVLFVFFPAAWKSPLVLPP